MSNELIQKLAQQYWDYSLKSSPTRALLQGKVEYYDQIESLNEESLSKDHEQIKNFQNKVNTIDRAILSPKNQIMHEMLSYVLETADGSFLDKSYEYDAGVAGFQDLLLGLNQLVMIPSEEAGDMMLKRLEKYETAFSEIASIQKKGLLKNRVATKRNLNRTIEQLESYMNIPVNQDTLLAVNFSSEISEQFKNNWKEKAVSIIEKRVRPSVQDYLSQLKNEHLPQGREDDKSGVIWIEGGEESYLRNLKKFTGRAEATVEQVHQVGLDEIERLHEEFFAIGKDVFQGVSSPKDVIKKMQTEESMRYESKEQMIALAEDAIRRAYKPLDKWFTVFPKSACKVLPVPAESEQHAPPAYYYPPSVDGSREGTYFLNTYDAKSKSIFEAESVAFHEAIPGHHLDRTIAVELKDVAEFQKHSASTAFVEGWGLYSEQLANEMGLYSSEVQQLGRLGNDAWRACRLVLDTGMHGKRWSRGQAIEFFTENSPIEEINSNIEVDRYIAWPGQACSYKMGQLRIQELRAHAKSELGENFDIRLFHDEVLCDGGITIPILEKKIEAFITTYKN